MATVPREDNLEQSSMNTLDPNRQQQDDQLKQEQANLQPVGGAVSGTSMQSPTAAPTPQNTPMQQASGQSNAASAGGKGSGTYTNLQAYQKANQGVAQNIAGEVGRQQGIGAQKIGQQIEQQKSSFQRQVDENRKRMEQAGQFIEQTVAGAGQGNLDDTAFNRFQNLLQGQEKFEVSAPDFSKAQNQIQNFTIPSQGLDRQNARMELLRRTFGGQDEYTSGQRALDDFLVAASPEARQTIAEAPRQAQKVVQDQLAAARSAAQQERALLGQEGENLRTQAQSSVDIAQQALLDELKNRQADISSSLGIGPQLKEAVASGNVSQELLDTLGIEDNRLFGVDVNEYLTAAPTIEGIGTQQDLARAQALARLEGSEQDIFLDPSQIGSFSQTEQNQVQALRDAVAARRGEYMTESERLRNLIGDLETNKNKILGLMPENVTPLETGYTNSIHEGMARSQRNQKAQEQFDRDLARRAGELGISQDVVTMLKPYLEQESGFRTFYPWQNIYLPKTFQGYEAGDLLQSLGATYDYDPTKTLRSQIIDPNRLNQMLSDALTSIQNKYDYGDVLNPVSAKDGAVKKSPRLDALKKLIDG